MNENELSHYGIRGQKWGIRRYQNADGTLTAEGKKRYGTSEQLNADRNKAIAKKVATAAIMTATVAAAAIYVKKHPEVITKVASKIKDVKVKDLSQTAVAKGKQYIKKLAGKASKGEDLVKQQRKKDIKNIRSLSNGDLKSKIERLKLEKQYKDLVKEDVSPSRKFISDTLAKAGKTVLGTAVTGSLAYAGKVAVEKMDKDKKVVKPSEVAAYLFPNPNKKKK